MGANHFSLVLQVWPEIFASESLGDRSAPSRTFYMTGLQLLAAKAES